MALLSLIYFIVLLTFTQYTVTFATFKDENSDLCLFQSNLVDYNNYLLLYMYYFCDIQVSTVTITAVA